MQPNQEPKTEPLSETETLCRLILDESSDPIFIVDENGTYVYVNRAFAVSLGRTPSEIIGRRIGDLFSPSQTSYRLAAIRAALSTGETKLLDAEVISGGQTRHYLATVKPLRRDVVRSPVALCIAKDITERREADEALLRRELRYRTILDTALDGFFEVDQEGRLLEVSEAYCQLLGYGREALLALKLSDLSPPAARAELGDQLQRALREGSARFEMRQSRQDGGLVELETSLKYLPDDARYCAFVREITDRKRTEAALRESEQRFRAIADYTYDWENWVGPDGKLIWVNPAVSRITGYSVAECLEMPDYPMPLVDERDRERIARYLVQAQAQATGDDLEFRLRCKDGTIKWAEVSFQPIFDGSGTCIGHRSSIHDISRRTTAEERQFESEHLVQRVLATTPNLIYIYDLVEARTVYTNLELTGILGYTTDQVEALEPDCLGALLHPDDLSAVTAHRARLALAEDGDLLEIEFRLRHAAGGWRWLLSRDVVFARDERGRVREILGSAEDVTQRRQAEAALRDSEARFRRIFDQSPVGALIVSLDQRFVRINDAHCRFLGYSAEELIGRTFRDITHPDDLQVGIEQVARLVAGEIDSYVAEKRYVRKDGKAVWGRLSTCIVKDPSGKPICFLPMVEDINDRKLAEQALGEKTEELERFFTLSLDLLCIADMDGRFRMLNPAWEATLGYARDELLGACLLDLVHPDDQLRTREAMADLARGKQVLNFTNRYRCKSGEYRWIEWRSAPHGDRLIYAAARDVTDRIRHEQEQARLADQLRQSQKLESVGRLAGGIAHDFNNLLTCITGHVSLAMFDVAPEHPLHTTMVEIGRAADSAAALTRQLLAFSRKQILTPRILDLNQLVGRMHQMLVRLIGEDIELRPVMQPGLGRVRVDAGQVEQILINLAVNARDAMPDGGLLTVETADVMLDDECARQQPGLAPGAYVMLAVSDTGSGMSAEVQQHLFEPFFTTKPKDKGTGLGLATVYGAVQQAGGSIQVDSVVGRGTRFRIYLPRVEPSLVSVSPPRAVSGALSGTETVLLVEDEPVVMRLAERVLSRLGYNVLSAASAMDAVRLAKMHEGDIHLLMTDVVMPQMNGRVMAQQIQEARPHIRVLYTSGYTEDVIAHHGVLEEGIHFLGKPYTAEMLATKLREVLG